MSRARFSLAVVLFILVTIVSFVVRNQLRVARGRQARAVEALVRALHSDAARAREIATAGARARQIKPVQLNARQALFDLLQPVAVTNCWLERFGEPHDGGYLMCANLLGQVEAGYSYGIAGYDKWGCDVSTKLKVPVHQYDCFDTRQPACPGGRTIFHAECVGGETATTGGRLFDTIERQVARNGDAGKHIVLKIDVEGAEWDTFTQIPDALLNRIDQLSVEFHRTADEDEKYLMVVERLKRFFDVAHLHFNNFSCVQNIQPFTAWAYEVLLVNKRLAVTDPSRPVTQPHPLDAPNDPANPDCQPLTAVERRAPAMQPQR